MPLIGTKTDSVKLSSLFLQSPKLSQILTVLKNAVRVELPSRVASLAEDIGKSGCEGRNMAKKTKA